MAMAIGIVFSDWGRSIARSSRLGHSRNDVVVYAGFKFGLRGPWVQDPGNGYTRVGYRMYSSADGFRRGQATGLTYEAHSATAYTEWGLPGGLQVIADMPFIWAVQRGSDGIGYHHDWTGDVRLEVDYAVLPSARSTVGVEVRLPTYKRPMEYAAAKTCQRTTLMR